MKVARAMAKVHLKICGITNSKDAAAAISAGADFLGFNFYKGSPRYIDPAKARRIVRRLPKGIQSVGVFMNETEDSTLEIARRVGLGYVQLHGDESPQAVRRLKRSIPVIKALRVRKPVSDAEFSRFSDATALLLDTFDARKRGGTGKTFDWDVALRAKGHSPIFLAGGITPENVADAIRTVKPYAVDVCSGVESSPGRKDPARLKALARAIALIQPVRRIAQLSERRKAGRTRTLGAKRKAAR